MILGKTVSTFKEFIGKWNVMFFGRPQGLAANEFKQLSQQVLTATENISDDVVIQGSRAAGTAKPSSDIDIAIKVDESQFNNLISKAFGNPNVGSAKWKTMQHAIETGKIQAGEAGFRGLRKKP